MTEPQSEEGKESVVWLAPASGSTSPPLEKTAPFCFSPAYYADMDASSSLAIQPAGTGEIKLSVFSTGINVGVHNRTPSAGVELWLHWSDPEAAARGPRTMSRSHQQMVWTVMHVAERLDILPSEMWMLIFTFVKQNHCW